MPNNPFRELALDAAALGDLTPEQLKRIIDSQYKALQMIHHPDHGGDENKSRALNEARDALSDLANIKLWREQALKAGVKARLQQQLDLAAKQYRAQLGLNLRLYVAMCRSASLGCYVDLLGLGQEQILLSHHSSMADMDKAMIGFRNDIEDDQKRKDARRAARQEQIDSHFTTLAIVNGRLMETDHKQQSKDVSNRLLVGIVSEMTIIKYFNGSSEPIHSFLAKVCRTGRQRPETRKLPFRYKVSSGKPGISTQITWSNFVRMMPYLTMGLELGGQLFSMKLQPDGLPIFRLEGKISTKRPSART